MQVCHAYSQGIVSYSLKPVGLVEEEGRVYQTIAESDQRKSFSLKTDKYDFWHYR